MSVERVRPETRRRENAKRRHPERRPSALKHGVFSTAAVLPGEDPEEFDALHQSLIDEWQPDGILEEETVRSLAGYLWRKNRVDIFARVQEVTARHDEVERAMAALIVMAISYIGNPEGLRENITESLARPRLVIPETDLMRAIIELRPALEGTEFLNSFAPLAKIDRAYETIFDAFGVSEKKRNAWMASHREDADGAATLAKVITMEQFEKELDLRERLDAAIDRCAKRLLQLKAGKRMVELDSRTKALPKPQGIPQPKLRSV